MREIKFRGKTEKFYEWIYGSLIIDDAGDYFIVIRSFARYNELDDHYFQKFNYLESILVIPETVGQYMWHKDKNGKEIYEGDVIKFYSSTLDKEIILVVGFEKNDWGWLASALDCEPEIIGNVFDNPELLKEK